MGERDAEGRAMPNTESQSISTTDGADLEVWTSGPLEAEAVVLIHGFSLDHTTWGPVGEALAARGFRVVMPDLRGHGRSTLGSAAPTLDRLVHDVAEVMEALGISPAHLVGHSLGAVVALAARADTRIAGSIATVTSIAGTEQAVQNPIMKLGARLFSSSLGISLLRRRRPGRIMISTWFGKNSSAADLDWIRLLFAEGEPATRSAVAAATADVDLRPTFGAPGPPTLVLCGQRDQATPAKISKRIAGAIDGAEFHLAEAAGHMVIIEDPGFVVEKVANWIGEHT